MNCKIILEMGCNHNGSIEIAKELIDQAAKLKVWGVKFQKRDIESMPKHLREMKRGGYNDFGNTYEEHRKFLEFTVGVIKVLKEYVENKGLRFVVSVFDSISLKQMILYFFLVKRRENLYCVKFSEKFPLEEGELSLK